MPNLQTRVQSIPRTLVRNYFDAARLPLKAAGSVLRRGDKSAEWAPALAFDAVEANVKQVVGALLRDDELTQEGRLAQAKVAQLRKAADLETLATQAKAEADAEYRQRIEADEQAKATIEDQAEAREAALADEKARRQREAAAKARRQAEAARKAAAAEEQVVAKQERAARSTRVRAEQEAVRDQRKALEATEDVIAIDRALEATKAARKGR